MTAMHRDRTNLLFFSPDLSQGFAARFKVNNLLRRNFVRDLFRARRSRLLNLFVLVVSLMNIINLVCRSPCEIRAIRRRSKWFFSFRLDLVVPGCPAVRSALPPPVTTVAETVELLRLSGPGQCPREPS